MINDTLILPLLSCHSFLGTGREQKRNSDQAKMYHKYGMVIFFPPASQHRRYETVVSFMVDLNYITERLAQMVLSAFSYPQNPTLRTEQGQPSALIRGMRPWPPGGTPLRIQVGPWLLISSQGTSGFSLRL